ncbi:group II intron maturase-specific domain-containing protein [Streptomyces sp. NPDC098085]|uniref:group II intron maturase-specific domain-containing protein n=1 Tax=unclassified Streptomyces TaxID=2593676 RepID=UPI0037F5C7CF
MRGWINCFGRFHPSALLSTLNRINDCPVRWLVRKYKWFKRKRARARKTLSRHARRFPGLLAHWKLVKP